MKDQRIHSYIVSVDTGFAPNPYGGICSIATCKPVIRRTAQIGDWVIGTTPKKVGVGQLVFAMHVNEVISFRKYWEDPRFSIRKQSKNNPVGDNIYAPSGKGYKQIKNRCHGTEECSHDLSVDRVLLATEFYYFGQEAPMLPPDYISLACEGAVRSGPEAVKELAQLIHDFSQRQMAVIEADLDNRRNQRN